MNEDKDKTLGDDLEEIRKIKASMGEKLLILTHHYQREDIVDLGDIRGDSFELSKKAAADKKAEHIVFCGVHFMAEAAAILARPHQTVQIPDMDAGCPMADMANIVSVRKAWDDIAAVVDEKSVIPIVYMNSDAEIKAFCGARGGLVCTSSNTPAAFQWGFDRGEKVFFFPDRHLGTNTANRLGISPDETVVWAADQPFGGLAREDIRKAKLILWDGYCIVHTRFRPEHVTEMRTRHPDAKIVVHPECEKEVVNLADAAGSTSFIVNYVRDAKPGETVIIGTEINLVTRLASEFPDRNVIELHHSLCANMFKISPERLLYTLNHIGEHNVVDISREIKSDARKALDRMLELA